MRKQRSREGKEPAQSHTASKEQRQDGTQHLGSTAASEKPAALEPAGPARRLARTPGEPSPSGPSSSWSMAETQGPSCCFSHLHSGFGLVRALLSPQPVLKSPAGLQGQVEGQACSLAPVSTGVPRRAHEHTHSTGNSLGTPCPGSLAIPLLSRASLEGPFAMGPLPVWALLGPRIHPIRLFLHGMQWREGQDDLTRLILFLLYLFRTCCLVTTVLCMAQAGGQPFWESGLLKGPPCPAHCLPQE